MAYSIAYFPFQSDNESNSMMRCKTIEETMKSVIMQFLKVRKRARLGKNVGSSLPDILFNTYTNENLQSQSQIIKQELIEQFPEFIFHSLNMELKLLGKTYTLVLTITISSSVSDIIELELLFPKN